MAKYLNISVEGKHSGLKLIVYPQSSKAKVFEEREPLPGETRWQQVEGCTYAYELVDEKEDCRYQFAKENEIVKFHLNTTDCQETLHALCTNMGSNLICR